MPADRLLHARLGHSAKVSSLTGLEYRVWTTYVLAADDFGVMRADAVAFQAAHDALSRRPAEEIARCVERLVGVALAAAFEHQGARCLYQWDWRDFQRVRFPARTLHPLPESAEVSARTHHLWSVHPGGARVPALPQNFGSASAQLPAVAGRCARAAAADATVKVLRAAVDRVKVGRRQEAAAAAWHAEPVVCFLCSTFGVGITGVRVSEENYHRDHGRTLGGRAGGDDDRCGTGRHLRLQGRHGRGTPCGHVAGRSIVRTDLDRATDRSGGARQGQELVKPRSRPTRSLESPG